MKRFVAALVLSLTACGTSDLTVDEGQDELAGTGQGLSGNRAPTVRAKDVYQLAGTVIRVTLTPEDPEGDAFVFQPLLLTDAAGRRVANVPAACSRPEGIYCREVIYAVFLGDAPARLTATTHFNDVGGWNTVPVRFNVTLAATADGPFVRGDINGDGAIDITDLSVMSAYFSGRQSIGCQKAADVNDDGAVDVTDLLLLHTYYTRGTPLAGPSSCGRDATADSLTCFRVSATSCR